MAYPCFYSKTRKGTLCFDPNQSVMKMTVTGCCQLQKVYFENGKFYIDTGKCYGADTRDKLQELKDGDDLKVVQKESGGKQPELVETLTVNDKLTTRGAYSKPCGVVVRVCAVIRQVPLLKEQEFSTIPHSCYSL